jgi:hypothetical protein
MTASHKSIQDIARGVDSVAIRGFAPRVVDGGLFNPLWSVDKFLERKDRIYKAGRRGVPLDEIMQQFPDLFVRHLAFLGNCFLNEGINEIFALVCGTGATKFDNTNAYIGVGDSDAAADPLQTDLQGASKTYKAMDASYPTYGSSQKGTWRSTFGSGDANYAWKEITVANGSSGAAKNMNRKVQAMGTKTSDYTWITTLENSLS